MGLVYGIPLFHISTRCTSGRHVDEGWYLIVSIPDLCNLITQIFSWAALISIAAIFLFSLCMGVTQWFTSLFHAMTVSSYPLGGLEGIWEQDHPHILHDGNYYCQIISVRSKL